jgi:Tfp pilus assembly protein PilZ
VSRSINAMAFAAVSVYTLNQHVPNPQLAGVIMTMQKQTGNRMNIRERIGHLVDNLTDEKKQLLLNLLLEWQQAERRDDSRVPCLIAVDYSDRKRVYHDFIQDLSKGGVFIETREPLQLGEAIGLTFSMPTSENHFKVSGKIVRKADGGIGVQFDNKLSRYQEEIIRTLVKRKK